MTPETFEKATIQNLKKGANPDFVVITSKAFDPVTGAESSVKSEISISALRARRDALAAELAKLDAMLSDLLAA